MPFYLLMTFYLLDILLTMTFFLLMTFLFTYDILFTMTFYLLIYFEIESEKNAKDTLKRSKNLLIHIVDPSNKM